MNRKPFDCVAMKRRHAAEIYDETKDMDAPERAVFWRRRTEALRKRKQAARRSR